MANKNDGAHEKGLNFMPNPKLAYILVLIDALVKLRMLLGKKYSLENCSTPSPTMGTHILDKLELNRVLYKLQCWSHTLSIIRGFIRDL